MTTFQFTKYGFRIKMIHNEPGFTWLFLPGGPGLGSEYLAEFCEKLRLPGTTLLIDFPKDGTNQAGQLNLDCWRDGLIDLVSGYAKPIVVTHSFAGMLIQDMPDLEHALAGLVLMNTTTRNSFFEHTRASYEMMNLPDLFPAASAYHLHPSDQTYREFWEAYKYYCFTPAELLLGEQLIQLFAFNNTAYHYALQNFYNSYQAKWAPSFIPTMTISSANDWVCPPDIFRLDPAYQSVNIINVIIDAAGHYPWMLKFAEVKKCFEIFIRSGLGLS